MEHGKPGEQNDDGDPEMNIGEDGRQHVAGFLRRFFVKHLLLHGRNERNAAAKLAGASSGLV